MLTGNTDAGSVFHPDIPAVTFDITFHFVQIDQMGLMYPLKVVGDEQLIELFQRFRND